MHRVEVKSLCDFSTNFCNLFNLYCNEVRAPSFMSRLAASVTETGVPGRWLRDRPQQPGARPGAVRPKLRSHGQVPRQPKNPEKDAFPQLFLLGVVAMRRSRLNALVDEAWPEWERRPSAAACMQLAASFMSPHSFATPEARLGLD